MKWIFWVFISMLCLTHAEVCNAQYYSVIPSIRSHGYYLTNPGIGHWPNDQSVFVTGLGLEINRQNKNKGISLSVEGSDRYYKRPTISKLTSRWLFKDMFRSIGLDYNYQIIKQSKLSGFAQIGLDYRSSQMTYLREINNRIFDMREVQSRDLIGLHSGVKFTYLAHDKIGLILFQKTSISIYKPYSTVYFNLGCGLLINRKHQK